jgi:hypothetical protein
MTHPDIQYRLTLTMLRVWATLLLSISSCLAQSWEPFGPTIFSGESSPSAFGSVIKVSDDGKRMAIGAPEHTNGNGAVFVYEQYEDSWDVVATIPGFLDEGLGDFISISNDGLWVAVRRYHVSPNVVQVYQVTTTVQQVGSDVSCGSDGDSVTLGQASIDPASGNSYWLAIGCESHDANRGLVQVFQLHDDNKDKASDWMPYLSPLLGANQGDRFGSTTAFVESPSPFFSGGRVFRIAVSSPNYRNGSGLVQVYTAIDETGWSRLGSSLVGDAGELFGSSIGFSATEQPYIVVGSPRKTLTGESGLRGMVQVFHWRSLTFGDPLAWHLVGTPLLGVAESDQFGHSVAITADGSRIAASSIEHDNQRGYVGVYDRDTYDSFALVSDLIYGGEPRDVWGHSVALNRYGSTVVSGSVWGDDEQSVGNVRVFLDKSPFCMIPSNTVMSEESTSVFVNRITCRRGPDLVLTEGSCSNTHLFQNGKYIPCVWVITDTPVTKTVSPSAPPSDVPTFYSPTVRGTSSEAPSPMPSPETSPPDVLDRKASYAPSQQASTAPPTLLLSSIPSTVPSLSPNYAPSSSPTIQDSGGPSEGPSGAHTTHPSLLPSTEPGILPTSTPSILATIALFEEPTTRPSGMGSVEPITTMPTSSKIFDETDEVYTLRACPCDYSGRCTSQPLSNGSILGVCVRADSTEIELLVVDALQLEQQSVSLVVIENGETGVLGATSRCSGVSCEVQTPVSPGLFEDDRSGLLLATGRVTVSLKTNRFLRAGSQRQLRRVLNFQAIISLGLIVAKESTVEFGGGDRNEGFLPPWLLWLLVALLVLTMAIVCCGLMRHQAFAKRSQR